MTGCMGRLASVVRVIWILASVNWAVMRGGLPPVGGNPPNPLFEKGGFWLKGKYFTSVDVF